MMRTWNLDELGDVTILYDNSLDIQLKQKSQSHEHIGRCHHHLSDYIAWIHQLDLVGQDGWDGTGWDRMGQDGTGWDRMGQDGTGWMGVGGSWV